VYKEGKRTVQGKPAASRCREARPQLMREKEALSSANLRRNYERRVLQTRHLRDPRNGPLSERELDEILSRNSSESGLHGGC
jgi:hypothetical protein